MDKPFRYPLAGPIDTTGFAEFLSSELGTPGANVRRFVAELCDAFGAERLTLVNSGASAVLAAAFALAEQTGRGQALASGFTSATTLSALQAAGYEVSLVDVEADGFNVDLEALEASIGPSTKVLCVNHFLGFPAPIDEIHELASRRGLLVLQDCSQSMDLRVGGGPAHRRGTLATWSFGHADHLSSFGGGAVVSPDEDWHRKVESLACGGQACTCHTEALDCVAPEGLEHHAWFERAGFDLQLSELNAVFGRSQLRSFRVQEDRRRRYRTLYDFLHGHTALRLWPAPEDSGSPAFFPVTVREGDPEDIAARLCAREVEVRSLETAVACGQPAFRNLPHDGLSRCTALAASTFLVGIHQTLKDEEMAAVARLINEEAVL
ncbi:MAG TPA: aminotransferase class V-fold PLP-dependent enzyme [Myxococcales bacterium]|jgi:CDP-6-deoxy-D-xylo-4-hexulose-3-dehydrase